MIQVSYDSNFRVLSTARIMHILRFWLIASTTVYKRNNYFFPFEKENHHRNIVIRYYSFGFKLVVKIDSQDRVSNGANCYKIRIRNRYRYSVRQQSVQNKRFKIIRVFKSLSILVYYSQRRDDQDISASNQILQNRLTKNFSI